MPPVPIPPGALPPVGGPAPAPPALMTPPVPPLPVLVVVSSSSSPVAETRWAQPAAQVSPSKGTINR